MKKKPDQLDTYEQGPIIVMTPRKWGKGVRRVPVKVGVYLTVGFVTTVTFYAQSFVIRNGGVK